MMKYDELAKLSRKEKIDLLEDVVKNDINYWKKLLLVMNLETGEENIEVIDKIVEHKIEEIELLKSKYNIKTEKIL